MKNSVYLCGLLILLACCHSMDQFPNGDSQYQSFAPDGIPFVISDMEWKADMQGNHRAVVTVSRDQAGKTIVAELPWRRPDRRPETKKVIVVEANTGLEIQNVCVRELSSEKGSILFEASSVPGDYYIYYLPYHYRKNHGDARYGKPWNDYLLPEYKADSTWLMSLSSDNVSLPHAKVQRFESRSQFDAFTSMGTIATQEEMDSILKSNQDNFILFTEDRAFPIRLTDQLPVRWIQTGPSDSFLGKAMRNEYYVWQLGIWAARGDIKNVKLSFSDFQSGSEKISKEAVTCFNQEGTNWDGKPVSFTVNVSRNKIQALWCGIQIPEQAKPGTYSGKVTITAEDSEPRVVDVSIIVDKNILADKGDSDLWRHARLRWLNSQIGTDSLPIAPYETMSVKGNRIQATDKLLTLGSNGLPESIRIGDYEVLSSPFDFLVETLSGTVPFKASDIKIKQNAGGLISWTSSSNSGKVHFDCSAYMEYDGYIRYHLKVSSDEVVPVNDIKLVTTYTPYTSEYFMGTGFKGGSCPEKYVWDWKGPWDSYWIGNARAGLHVEYRGGAYHGPLLNDYKPAPPLVWANNGKGTISVSKDVNKRAKVIASTGRDTLRGCKDFEFALLITPVKQVNSGKHFSERYYHADPKGFDKAAEEGANIENIHHAQCLNPVINYPFIIRDSLIQHIEHQHQHNRKVKIYYTIRELTNHTTEIYALKSLNHEIFVQGVGYGLPWQCEHLVNDYKPAWYATLPEEHSDDALVLNGFSRWINYYLEGARWMYENYKLDGLYMDDVSFDRTVMKRMRKIMVKYRPEALIDLHSNTGYSIGPANQYTDFFPYVDRLWFGESFQYNKMHPDEWFVTFSGIPFGVMSEMLQDGGNRFLGMVYGTTARHSSGQYSPAPVWALWKSFGIEEAKMLGYWDEACPIKTSDPEVKATAYVKPDKVLISIGNFSNQDKSIHLTFDWKALGMNEATVSLEAPFVKDFQQASTFKLDDRIPVKSKEGWLLVLSRK